MVAPKCGKASLRQDRQTIRWYGAHLDTGVLIVAYQRGSSALTIVVALGTAALIGAAPAPALAQSRSPAPVLAPVLPNKAVGKQAASSASDRSAWPDRVPGAPEPLLPAPSASAPASSDALPAEPAPTAAAAVPGLNAVIAPQPIAEPVMSWTTADARALLDVIDGIAAEGLIPADYEPAVLRAAIKQGEGDPLDQAASRSFAWLAEDLREGRTPMEARQQWFAVDPDREAFPTATLMAAALSDHDVPGVLTGLDPTVPDYAALKQALAETRASDKARLALIRVNMDRWRWLARDLGDAYLLTNVPEFQLRLTVKNRIVRTYKTVVGKPGRTATPQLAETVQAVVFNPTWTVPQSIVKGEGLGARLSANAASARRQGYKVTKAADGTIYVVQQPGDHNALGRMKIDMPNPHAIYLHDTPEKALFAKDSRAFSHGCIRTERAVELGMTMGILGAGLDPDEAADISRSGKYTKVAMTRTFPVYITYVTIARDINGELKTFADIYGRDKPVFASFTAPREQKTNQRKSAEPVMKLDNPT